MALINVLISPWTVAAAIALYYLYPYFVTNRAIRHIPAPFPAQFTNFWLLSVCRRGNRYSTIDEIHKKLGPVVRIQPNHISVAADAAIQEIYGHGNGFLKSYLFPTLFSFTVTDTRPANSTTPSSPSAAGSSTLVTAQSIPASERSSLTPSHPSPSPSSSRTLRPTWSSS